MQLYYKIEELPPFLYHATTTDCIDSLEKGILLSKCNQKTDFGKGFYLTSNFKQAKQWASAKENVEPTLDRERNIAGAIAVFKLDTTKLANLNNRFFIKEDIDWVDFIYGNRSLDFSSDHNQDSKFDFVYGPLADGRTNFLVGLLQKGHITLEEFHKRLKGNKFPFPIDHQMSFHTQESLNALQFYTT